MKLRFSFWWIFIIVLSAQITLAQPQIDWGVGRRFRQYSDRADVVVNSINNTYLTSILTHDGESFTFGLARISHSGDTLWSRFYDFPGRNYPKFLSPIEDGGCFVGTFTSYENLPHWIFRFAANGDTLWSYRSEEIYDIYPVGNRFTAD